MQSASFDILRELGIDGAEMQRPFYVQKTDGPISVRAEFIG